MPVLEMILSPQERTDLSVKHAANRVVQILDQQSSGPLEPYFEDEPLTELGFSFETHIFGGMTLSLIENGRYRRGPGLPSGGVIKSYFFQAMSKGYGGTSYVHTPVLLSFRSVRDYAPDIFIQRSTTIFSKACGPKRNRSLLCSGILADTYRL